MSGDSSPDTVDTKTGLGDASPDSSPEAPEATAEPETPQEIVLADLVKDQKFKFEDKDWTLDELKKSIMRQKDYTKKTQEISTLKKEYEQTLEERKFYEALPFDLEKVKQNPALAMQFKQTYPEKFHQYVAQFESDMPLDLQTIKQMIQQEIKSGINPLQESLTNREAEALTAKYDAWDKELAEKYPHAHINLVYSMIDQAKAQGLPMNQKATWEQAWKASNDTLKEHYTKISKANFQDKKQLNQAARDIKPGGQIAGQAPKEAKGLKEAGQNFTEYLKTAMRG